MAHKKSEASKYASRFGAGFITGAALIAERICENIARLEKETLRDHFWQDTKWKKTFSYQVVIANKLLNGTSKAGRSYSVSAILKALDHSRAYRVKSLAALYILKPLFDAEQDKLEAQEKALAEAPTVDFDQIKIEPPRPSTGGKSTLFNKLKDLD